MRLKAGCPGVKNLKSKDSASGRPAGQLIVVMLHPEKMLLKKVVDFLNRWSTFLRPAIISLELLGRYVSYI